VCLPNSNREFYDIFSRFHRIPACDRQSDGQTDGHHATVHTRRAVIAVVMKFSQWVVNGFMSMPLNFYAKLDQNPDQLAKKAAKDWCR